MLFCFEISLLQFYAFLSQNLIFSDLGTLWVEKISKNCISGEKITNMRSAPFLQCQYFNWNCYSNPSFTDTKRFFTATDTDTKILICLSFKHRHQLISSSAHCQHQHQGQLSSYAYLFLISISSSITIITRFPDTINSPDSLNPSDLSESPKSPDTPDLPDLLDQ